MDRFTELQTFVAVADAGGFNAGARALQKSPPTVTRLVQGLEDRLGARLFIRTTRQIALTEAGVRLLADARNILEHLASAEASAMGAHEAPQGVLAVTAPMMFGRMYVAPVVQDFLEAHPQLRVRALFVDRNVNLIEEGLDVAVRVGQLPDSSLTATRVGTVRRVAVASPEYLRRCGEPMTPSDLEHHRLTAPAVSTQANNWVFEASGRKTVVPIEPAFVANTIDVAIGAATAGWAVTRVLSYQVASALREGALVEVLSAAEDREMPIHLVHAEGPLRAAKIRAFVDFAAKALRAEARHWIG